MNFSDLLHETRVNTKIPFGHIFELEMKKKVDKFVRVKGLSYEIDDKIRIKVIRKTGKIHVHNISNDRLIRTLSVTDERDAIRKLIRILKKV